MNLFHIVMKQDLKKVKPTVLRRYSINAGRFLALSKSDLKIRCDVRNLGIFHPHIGDWEIDNMSQEDLILILQLGERNTEAQKELIAKKSLQELRVTVGGFRDNVRKMGSLSGLRFVLERCTDQEFAIVTQDMYVQKMNTMMMIQRYICYASLIYLLQRII